MLIEIWDFIGSSTFDEVIEITEALVDDTNRTSLIERIDVEIEFSQFQTIQLCL